MSTLNEICKELIQTVDGALGAAVVDLESGLLLGVAHSVPYFTQSYLDAVAAAAVDMFRGETVCTVEELLANTRGVEVTHMVREIQMTTNETFHFMSVIMNKTQCVGGDDHQQKDQPRDGLDSGSQSRNCG